MRTSKAGTWTEGGFTLIEMMSVLFVVGMLLALLAPFVHRGQALREAGRSLVGTVRAAYAQAVVTRRVWSLCMDLARGEYWMGAGSCGLTGGAREAGESGPRRATLSPEVRFLDVQTGQREVVRDGLAVVRFFPIGLAERGVIHLEDQARNRLSLLIHPLTGLVSAEDGYVTKEGSDGAFR